MVREGRTRKHDTLDASFFRKLGEAKAVSEKDFETAKTRYYQLRGWDSKTGHPTEKALTDLGLSDIARGLKI